MYKQKFSLGGHLNLKNKKTSQLDKSPHLSLTQTDDHVDEKLLHQIQARKNAAILKSIEELLDQTLKTKKSTKG
jgi:hypothetical protein